MIGGLKAYVFASVDENRKLMCFAVIPYRLHARIVQQELLIFGMQFNTM